MICGSHPVKSRLLGIACLLAGSGSLSASGMGRVECGASKLTLLVFGSILAAVGYCAYNVVPFFYCYHEMQNQMDQMVRVASTVDDAEIRKRLWYHVKKCEIPAEPEDLHIERTVDGIKVWMPYQETFSITWGDKEREIYKFDFYPNAESVILER